MQSSCVLITYNCAKKLQTESRISDILRHSLEHNSDPELIVFCLQECAPILDASLGWTKEWLAPFESAVPETHNLVGQAVTGAVAVLVFGVPQLSIKSVTYDTLAFGFLWSSLKGAAMVTLHFDASEEKISFISAHLAANEGRKEERNRDFAYMAERFGIARVRGQVLIGGDLNYRTEDGTFRTDELSNEMKNERIAKGFVEAPLTFAPSFKFFERSNKYNPRRTASFCDRVLYREFEGLTVIKYGQVMSAEIDSDHKPVFLNLKPPANGPINELSMASTDDPSSANALLDSTGESDLGDNTTRSERLNGSPVPRRKYGSQAARWESLTSAVDIAMGSSAYLLLRPLGRLILGIGLGLFVFALFIL